VAAQAQGERALPQMIVHKVSKGHHRKIQLIHYVFHLMMEGYTLKSNLIRHQYQRSYYNSVGKK
jgi:hypothetical protein